MDPLGINIKINTVEFNRWLNGVAREQLPFAMAQALTKTAKDAQADLKSEAEDTFTLRNRHTTRGFRIKRAEKRDGLHRMFSEVGSIDWYIASQTDDKASTRQPRASTYRYIPKKARPNQSRNIAKRLKPAAIAQSSKVFWDRKPDGTALVYQRMGRKGQKLKLLYVAVPNQRVQPAFSFGHTVQVTAQKKLRRNLIKSMNKAIKSAR